MPSGKNLLIIALVVVVVMYAVNKIQPLKSFVMG